MMSPYIPQGDREAVWLNEVTSSGELNYFITRACKHYMEYMNKIHGTHESYLVYNTVIGVLECVKQEIYRRMVAPYEDKKCKENGDVY